MGTTTYDWNNVETQPGGVSIVVGCNRDGATAGPIFVPLKDMRAESLKLNHSSGGPEYPCVWQALPLTSRNARGIAAKMMHQLLMLVVHSSIELIRSTRIAIGEFAQVDKGQFLSLQEAVEFATGDNFTR